MLYAVIILTLLLAVQTHRIGRYKRRRVKITVVNDPELIARILADLNATDEWPEEITEI